MTIDKTQLQLIKDFPSLIPEAAPFAPSQRAWLNGFFAAIIAGTPPSSPAPAAAAVPAQEQESFPWHDPAIALPERLKMAEGRPRHRLFMAAMAQLDCGSCGYNCQRYAEAIATGSEKDLTRCAPGGRETARAIKELMTLHPATQTDAPPVAQTSAAGTHDRDNPYPARFVRARKLTSENSTRDVRHVVVDVKSSGLSYKPGDSLGVFADNNPDLVQSIITALGADGSEHVGGLDGRTASLREALARDYAIRLPSIELVELMARLAADAQQAQRLKELAADSDGSALQSYETVDLLEAFPSAIPTPADFVATLPPLQPRLYSISSSPRLYPDEIHLTVGVVRYHNNFGRLCRGVASACLGERMRPGERIRVFVQPTSHFTLPTDPDVPIIMVGPGTGIAPFIAFLQERKASGARGMNWLFCGGQHADSDYLYRAELLQCLEQRLLTRLDTAFSRDQEKKIYVQDRMLEKSTEIWNWITSGACIYVCGDARRMARDAEQALMQIVAREGRMSSEDAKTFVGKLSQNRRYMKDVY